LNLKRKGKTPTPVRRHLAFALAILLFVIIVGVTGYMLIEGMSFTEALYMTIVTISTVGFREVRELGTGGMYFTIFIILMGVSAVLFFLAGAFEYVLSEYLGDIWGLRKMRSDIQKLKGHYIVCGYGRVGKAVAEELASQGKDFVVIEHDTLSFEQCVRDGYLAINGSATDSEVLKEAGIESAVGLVSALKSDAENLYVVLTAKVMNKDIIIIARSDEPGAEEKLEMVGADRVISPHKIAGRRMANLLVRPQVCEFIDTGVAGNLPEYHLAEHRVFEGSSLVGKTIRDCGLRDRTGVTILAIKKAGEHGFNANPEPETVIEKDDVLILIGTPEQMALFEGKK